LSKFPESIFRYRPIRTDGKHWNDLFKREYDTIEKGYLWLSKFHELNDPMEGVLNRTNSAGICSFTSRSDNMMLWSLYTNNAGICIEYDTHALRKIEGINLDFVRYDNELVLSEKCLPTNLSPITKFEDWGNEEEIRLVGSNSGKLDHSHISNTVKKVILSINYGSLPSGNHCLGLCSNMKIPIETFQLKTLISRAA